MPTDPRKYEDVKLLRLDTALATAEKLPDIVKIDVQGAEGAVLDGARGLFAAGWRPIIILKFWPLVLRQNGIDPETFLRWLAELGYKIFEVGEEGLKRVDIEALDSCSLGWVKITPERFTDLLLIDDNSRRLQKITPFMAG